MKKGMLVFGTRPEAIKMCPLVKEFQKYPEEFETIVCVTGQHREMLDQVFRIFEVKPDYDLIIMKQGRDLYAAAVRASIVYSLVDTCKSRGVDPREWMEDVLLRIPCNENNREALRELLADKWAKKAN